MSARPVGKLARLPNGVVAHVAEPVTVTTVVIVVVVADGVSVSVETMVVVGVAVAVAVVVVAVVVGGGMLVITVGTVMVTVGVTVTLRRVVTSPVMAPGVEVTMEVEGLTTVTVVVDATVVDVLEARTAASAQSSTCADTGTSARHESPGASLGDSLMPQGNGLNTIVRAGAGSLSARATLAWKKSSVRAELADRGDPGHGARALGDLGGVCRSDDGDGKRPERQAEDYHGV